MKTNTLATLAGWCATALAALLATGTDAAVPVAAGMKSIGNAAKAIALQPGQERVVFEHNVSATATHAAIQQQWHAGELDFDIVVRVYVDGETAASVVYPVGLAHAARTTNVHDPPGGDGSVPTGAGASTTTNARDPGTGANALGAPFGVSDAPWAAASFGRTDDTGFFNMFLIPFEKSVRVTLQSGTTADRAVTTWYMARGSENAPLEVSHLLLPSSARLRVQRTTLPAAPAHSLVTMVNTSGAPGLLRQVVFRANSSSFAYQEGCVSAEVDGADELLWLSSGLEDYFLGAYFHSMPDHHLPWSGFSLNATPPPPGCEGIFCSNSIMAYRVHDYDPVLFEDSLQLHWIASADSREQGWCNFDGWPAAPKPPLPTPDPTVGTISVDTLAFYYVW